MERTCKLSLVLGFVLLAACDAPTKDRHYAPCALKEFRSRFIEAPDSTTFPTSGQYYIFFFDSSYDNLGDPIALISELCSDGIEVKAAWYRSSINGCSHPGGGISWTIYPPIFFLLLEEPDVAIEDHNFHPLSEPPLGACLYYFVEFSPTTQ